MKIQIALAKYIDSTGAGRAMLKYAGKDYYIHFGNTPKLGVNTKFVHSDLPGVYFYKLDWLIDNASFEQYALTFQYYTIVKINKASNGVLLQNFDDKALDELVRDARVETEYAEWLAYERKYQRSYKNTNSFLNFYRYLREQYKSKAGNLVRGIDYVEDDGDGFFNKKEPFQIVVRNPKIYRVVESGETKTRYSDLLAIYRTAIVNKLGKPSDINSKRSGNRIVGLSLKYKLFADYGAFCITFYPTYDAGVQDGWTVEINYRTWFLSAYHKGPDINYYSKKSTIKRDESIEDLINFVYTEYFVYEQCSSLVEDKWSDYSVEYLRTDLNNIEPFNAKNFVAEHGIKNKFLSSYVNQLIESRINNVTDADIIKLIPVFDPNIFDVIAADYHDIDMYTVSRTSKRGYKLAKSGLPQKRFNMFISDIKGLMSELLSNEHIADIFLQLEES